MYFLISNQFCFILPVTPEPEEVNIKQEENEVVDVESTSPAFKRPADVSPSEAFKRPR